jgi:hypothetical protein
MNPPEGGGDLLSHIQALYLADKYIANGEYAGALPWLVSLISPPPSSVTTPDAYSLKRACRIFAEINGALPNTDRRKQSPAAIQLLLFSKVKPNEWLGTQGVAATMLGKEFSIIGDVRMNYHDGSPILVQGDDYCEACNKPGAQKRCTQCQTAHYCDSECQGEDWKFHKLKCSTSRNMGTETWNSLEYYEKKLGKLREVIGDALEKKEAFGKSYENLK